MTVKLPECIGEVAIDTGQLVLADPCYLPEFEGYPDDKLNLNDSGQKPEELYPFSYEGSCNASSNALGGGQLGKYTGVSVRTGQGDGFYPVFVEYDEKTGKVARVVVEFLM